MDLNAYRKPKDYNFITIKDSKKLTFFIAPRVGVADLWIHRIPVIADFENDGEKVRTVYFKRHICPNPSACHYCSLKKHVRGNTDIADTDIVWDLKTELDGKRTKFTKEQLLGKNSEKGKDAWKNKFQTQKEIYLGIVDHSDGQIKLLQMSTGVWEKINKILAQQEAQFGEKGNPSLNPGCYALVGTYNEKADKPDDYYDIMKSEIVKADEETVKLLSAPSNFDIDKIFNKDHLEDIRDLCVKNCLVKWDYRDVDSSKRRSTVVKEEVKTQEIAKPAPAPAKVEQQKPEVKPEPKPELKEPPKVLEKAPEPKAEVKTSDDAGTYVTCAGCKEKINIDNVEKCPKCGKSVFPF